MIRLMTMHKMALIVVMGVAFIVNEGVTGNGYHINRS